MNHIDWTQLAIKLLTLFNILGLVIILPSLFSLLTTLHFMLEPAFYPSATFIWIAILTVYAIPGIVLVLIWKNSHRIAKRLWPEPDTSEPLTNVSFREVQRALFSALGLYVLVINLSPLLRSLGTLIQTRIEFSDFNYIDFGQMLGIAGVLVEMAIGTWLFFGSERIVQFLERIWNPTFGAPRTDEP